MVKMGEQWGREDGSWVLDTPGGTNQVVLNRIEDNGLVSQQGRIMGF